MGAGTSTREDAIKLIQYPEKDFLSDVVVGGCH